jgi:cobalt/nickel transport system permease protein
MSESAARWLDRLGYGDSPAHRLDARAKVIATACFVVCVASFPKYEVAELVPFAAFPVALAAAGRVPPSPVVRLLLAASPFALLVGAWNPLLDRAPRALVLGWEVPGGVLSFASLLLRFLLCTAGALVLVATTSVPRLVRALDDLGLPRPFLAQVQLLYRYLFLLADEGRRLAEARALREPRRRLPRLLTARRMLASLLWRTWARGDRIYDCMKARGYDGSFPALAPSRFTLGDAAFLAAAVLACAAGRALPLARWLGAAVLGAFA